MSYTSRHVLVGQGCMVMSSEDFVNGFQAGHLSYMLEARTAKFTDEALTTMIKKRREQQEHSERYNAGYIAGWIVALASKNM